MKIPFNRPFLGKRELEYVQESLESGHREGDGPFTSRCHTWLEAVLGTPRALLTHSGTAALEMAALLADIQPGDEVIMPSFTFVSTANAFVLRGGVPVFVDIDPTTQNIDPGQIERAITDRTRAIVPVHYAGVGCDMDAILDIARRHGLMVIEDAAHALLARYRGRHLGTIGDLGVLSFHDSKNTSGGEAGALLVNDPRLIARAEILRQKGTNRTHFLRGEVAKYSWIDVGSSYVPSDVTAAFLFAQLEEAEATKAHRRAAWRRYRARFRDGCPGVSQLPQVPPECEHNGHIFYVVLESEAVRRHFIERMSAHGIAALFHYVPLHTSQAGVRYARAPGPLPATEVAGQRLVRLPLWRDMPPATIDEVVARAREILLSSDVGRG